MEDIFYDHSIVHKGYCKLIYEYCIVSCKVALYPILIRLDENNLSRPDVGKALADSIKKMKSLHVLQ